MAITRVTFSSNILLIRNNLSTVQAQYEAASIPVTSGKKINNLSDDATVTARIFSLKSRIKKNEQLQRNVLETRNKVSFTETKVNQSISTMQRLRDLALSGNDPTLSSNQRTKLAEQVTQLKNELLSYANSKNDEKYIFSGTATNVQPFSGTPTTFSSSANNNLNTITINEGITMEIGLDGNEIFTGNIATAAGSSLATSLKNSNSIGLGLAIGDTIDISGAVGGVDMAGQTLTITATTDLDDIATAIQTALRSVADGDLTETASVQPDGSIRVTSDSGNDITDLQLTVSGKTFFNTAFDFADTISGGGATDDSDALQTGTGEDLFDIFDDLATAIEDGDQDAIGANLDRIDNGIAQLVLAQTDIGQKIQRLDSVDDQLVEDSINLVGTLSDKEDVNVDEAISNLVLKETALRMIFQTTSRILQVASGIQLSI